MDCFRNHRTPAGFWSCSRTWSSPKPALSRTGRELVERSQPLAHDRLRGHERPELVAIRAKVHARLARRTLERVLQEGLTTVGMSGGRRAESARVPCCTWKWIFQSRPRGSPSSWCYHRVEERFAQACGHLPFEERGEIIAQHRYGFEGSVSVTTRCSRSPWCASLRTPHGRW